jgi:peptidyl-tRNA hydrolase
MSDPSASSSPIPNHPSVPPPSTSSDPAPPSAYDLTLVQYVVMRSDLIKQFKWNIGGLIANGSHACISVISEHLEDEEVRRYIGLIPTDPPQPQMHKVVLSVKDETELNETAELLTKNAIVHRVWMEAPEQFPSCLATRPYQRHILQPLLRHLKLFR